MKTQRPILTQALTLTIVGLLISNCGPGQTQSPIPLSEPTVAVVASSALAEMPTSATSTLPKAGHWEGADPSVTFDIASSGDILNFELVVERTQGICTLDLETIKVKADSTFAINELAPYELLFSNLTDAQKEFIQANTVLPTPVKTDTGEMFEALNITGKFNSSTTADGIFAIMQCENFVFYTGYKPDTWKAEWKSP